VRRPGRRASRPLIHPFRFELSPPLQVPAGLLPADLEDRPTLAEMEALQRHRLDQLREVELGQLVEDVRSLPLVTIRLSINTLLDGHGPDFQDVAPQSGS
jgi:hypothetical protein